MKPVISPSNSKNSPKSKLAWNKGNLHIKKRLLTTFGHIVCIYVWMHNILKTNKGSMEYIIPFALYCLYHLKRILEISFIHRYGAADDELYMIFFEYTYLWGFSTTIGSKLFSNNYKPVLVGGVESDSQYYMYIVGFLLCLMLIFMFCTHIIHWKLRALRFAGGSGMFIPTGFWFTYISCPHYLFEVFIYIYIYIRY